MSFCQSLNKVVQTRRRRGFVRPTQVSDQLMPVFRRHRWEGDDCTRCFKTRNKAARRFGKGGAQ